MVGLYAEDVVGEDEAVSATVVIPCRLSLAARIAGHAEAPTAIGFGVGETGGLRQSIRPA